VCVCVCVCVCVQQGLLPQDLGMGLGVVRCTLLSSMPGLQLVPFLTDL